MTTSHSPIAKIRAQAFEIAERLKGRKMPIKPEKKDAPDITFAVVMDDKILKITMTWAYIDSLSMGELVDIIAKEMKK